MILNLQKRSSVDLKSLGQFETELLALVPEANERSVAVALISDRRMKELNSLFRGRDTTTDVLSFPHLPDEFDPDKSNLGDIVISAEQAERQAIENGLTIEGEIKQLMLHGLLHLCGYDHETDNGEMDSQELALRDKLKI